jgi:hypothetical protein
MPRRPEEALDGMKRVVIMPKADRALKAKAYKCMGEVLLRLEREEGKLRALSRDEHEAGAYIQSHVWHTRKA